ncbi:MAG: hypothetical protein NTX81_07290, partial [Candidatus Bathyarchaeota archaeon]|nr:hypothetical protein [Candidatus Bathyarchaeota archaeon]
MAKLSSRHQIIMGGVAGFLLGVLYQMGSDFYNVVKTWCFAPSLPSLEPRFLISTALMVGGLITIVYGIWFMRKEKGEGIQLYPFDRLPQLLSKAKEEVAFLGVSLEKISGNIRKIEQLLTKGIRVSFLVLDILEPDNVKLAMNVEDVGSSANLSGIKGDLLGVLCKTRSRLPEETKKRFEIKKYGIFPLHSMILIDPDADDGLILHEPHLYDTEPALRDHFLIPRKKNEATFQKYLKSYRFVLDKSVTYRCQTPVSSLVKVTRAKPEEEVKELHVRFHKFPSSPDKVYEARFC